MRFSYNSLFYDDSGEPKGIIGVNIDITERKQAEESLRRLVSAVETARDSITISDMEGRVVFVNPAAERMRGYRPGEMIGLSVDSCGPPSPVSENDSGISALALEQRSWSGETRTLRKDGTEFPIRLSTAVIRNEAGEPTGVVGISRDITAEKEAEATLQKSEERLRLALDAANIVIWDMDLQTNDVFVSSTIAKLEGRTERSSKPVYNDFLKIIHPEDRLRAPKSARQFMKALAGKTY